MYSMLTRVLIQILAINGTNNSMYVDLSTDEDRSVQP